MTNALNDYKWANSLARPVIAGFAAYSARGGATDALHMDANESPWSPPPAGPTETGYNRYPAQQPVKLMARLSGLYGIPQNSLMLGRGADEAIDVLMRTFCEAGSDNILICSPTFGYFSVAAKVQGAGIIDAPLGPDFELDKAGVQTALKNNDIKLVMLCSPNNPTGNSIEPDFVLSLCADNPETLIVVDEAYIEFSPYDSLVSKIPQTRNLVVTRTLSKAYGLAGVRAGVAIANPEIINLMLKVLPPYPVPRPVETAVLKALAPAAMAVHDARLTIWTDERTRLLNALPSCEWIENIYPSDANFILIKVSGEQDMLSALSRFNIKIRDFRSKLSGLFRISIGMPEDNDLLLTALGITPEAVKNERTAEEFRTTKETDISVRVNLDDPSKVSIETGLGFFDHMLEQIAKHGGMGLTLKCDGDLHIDSHHSIEDTALAFGAALRRALGNKAGIGRYGFVMPMDETQAKVAIDLSGRPSFVFNGEFPSEAVGEFAAEMCPHFFQSLSQALGASIQIDVKGDNTHHMIEACFKGVGRALRPAISRGPTTDIPSTKGVI